jgi:hypothetical protein
VLRLSCLFLFRVGSSILVGAAVGWLPIESAADWLLPSPLLALESPAPILCCCVSSVETGGLASSVSSWLGSDSAVVSWDWGVPGTELDASALASSSRPLTGLTDDGFCLIEALVLGLGVAPMESSSFFFRASASRSAFSRASCSAFAFASAARWSRWR